MTANQSFLFPVIFAALFAALIALLFDFAIKSSKIKTEYFGAYDSLVGYLKSILLFGLLIFLVTSNFFNYALKYLMPKDVSFEITIKEFYSGKPLDSLEVMVFMNTSNKKKLTSIGNGKYTGELTVRRDIEEATVYVASHNYRQKIVTYPKAPINNTFTDTFRLYPMVDTMIVTMDSMQLVFVESALPQNDTFSLEPLNKKTTIISHFRPKK